MEKILSTYRKRRNNIISNLICYLFFLTLFFWIDKPNGFISVITLLAGFLISTLIAGKFIILLTKFLLDQIKILGMKWTIVWIILSLSFGIWLTLNIPLPFPPLQFNPSFDYFSLKIILFISYSTLIGFLFFLCTIALSNLKINKSIFLDGEIHLKNMLLYSLPIFFIWSIYLLAFYPGMMSADSFNQWNQVLTGVYVNHHPVFHTLLIWLLTRIYLSPVIVALAQIFFMAFNAGLFFSFYESVGVPKWIIWVSLLVFSIIPVNGTMVNTIWKDIPHGIAVMSLVYFFIRIIYSSGQWINKWRNILLFSLILGFISLLRHDGIIIAIGSMFTVFIFFPKHWKSWLIAFAFFLVLFLGIRGPLYQSLNVQESKSLEESSLSLYQLAAFSLPGSEPDLIIRSMQIWPPNWNCSIWSKNNPEWKNSSIDKSQPKMDIVVNFAKRIPKILLYNYRCERSLEFIVWDPYGEVRNASHVEVLVDPNPFGIVADSKLPALRDFIANLVIKTSYNPNLNWLFWRPALFLYITFFTISILILRNRNFRFSLIIIPALLQAITLTLIFAAPNFRYYYATYLVALITIPLIFSPRMNGKTPEFQEMVQKG